MIKEGFTIVENFRTTGVSREVDNFAGRRVVLIGLSEASMAERNQRSSKASLPASDDNQILV